MRIPFALLPLLALPHLLRAEETAAPAPRTLQNFTMVDENDWWGKWSDKYYSNGTRFAWTGPDWFSDEGDSTIRRLSFAVTHEMYTPKGGQSSPPRPGDHPYAGFFYGSLAFSWETESHLDVVQLDLGIAGRSALAEKIQDNWHKLIDSPKLRGWNTQMRDEPVANLLLERRWRIDLAGNRDGWSADMLPRVVGIAGTVRTEAVAGAQFRFGKNLPRDFGHSFIRQNTAYYAPRDEDRHAFYGFLDIQGEAVARNMATQGGFVHDSLDVGRKPFVAQLSLGITYAVGGLRVSLIQSLRTEEFKGQDHAFAFGGLTGTVSF